MRGLAEQRRYSFETLMNNKRFHGLVETARAAGKAGDDLTRLQQDALDAYDKLNQVVRIINGSALEIVPVPQPSGRWSTPAEMKGAAQPERGAVYLGFVTLGEAYRGGDAGEFARIANELGPALRKLDTSGAATASLNVPGQLAIPVGFKLHHAFLVFDSATGQLHRSSIPASVEFKEAIRPAMLFAKDLRERVRTGEVTCSVRIWKQPRVNCRNDGRLTPSSLARP